MPGERHDGPAPDPTDTAYSILLIASRRSVWRWRLWVAFGATPAAWFLMQDAAPLTVFFLGFGLCAMIVTLAGSLADLEVRVRAIRAARK